MKHHLKVIPTHALISGLNIIIFKISVDCLVT